MSDVLETNVLIIGKSGTGKSSLLNYIFGEKKRGTGAGEPVTKKGFFKERLEINKDFVVNITDTWGLEANKGEEWENFIKDDINLKDRGGIKTWYHTILFCISAKGARIEEFEKKIIKNLIDSGNRIIIVLTHSDLNNVEEAIKAISCELERLGVDSNSIIKVSSVEKTLLTGKVVKPFGRGEIIEKIKVNIWSMIYEKLPYRLNSIVIESLDSWCEKAIEYSNSHIKWYNKNSSKLISRVSRYGELSLDLTLEDIYKKIEKEIVEVKVTYKRLIENFNKEEEKEEEIESKIEELETLRKLIPREILKLKSLKNILKTSNKQKESINKLLVEVRQKAIDTYIEENKNKILEIKNIKF